MCRCVFQLQTNVKTHSRWARAKAIEAKDICMVSYALPLTLGPFSIIFRWNINRAVNNNPLYWTMHGACITPCDVYASMIGRYAWTGSRDALGHSYSAENFPRLVPLALEYMSHRSIDYNCFSRDRTCQWAYQAGVQIESNLRVIVAIADYQGVISLW